MSSAPPTNSPSSDSPPSDEKSPPSKDNNNPSSQSPPQNDDNNNSSGNKNVSLSPSQSPNSSNKSPTSKDVSSPPPPRSSRNSISPPSKTHNKTPKSQTSSDSDSSSLSSSNTSLIAGLMVGLGLLLLVMLIICIVWFKKRKRKRENTKYYYGDHPPGGKYYNNAQQQNWQNNPQDHILRLNAQQGGGNSWASPPPPPPLPMSYSGTEMSGNFSGPYGSPLPPPSPNVSLGFNKSTFTYDELANATDGFSQVNLLGQGGFGYVHKGVLPNGKEVAVKSLKLNSGQGEREFQAEVDIISRVHHRHLVSLVGYCIAGGQRMLVYEFVPNNTLEYHLHGNDLPNMSWPTRLRIAIGSAKGLAYLHEDCHPRIIHRDIKSANILIDNNFEAMVADFGLAKLSSDNYTHVSTRVMGTFGYLAPEYASSGKLTEKSDVFSFGIMLLEIITGRRPVDHTINTDDSLVDWARPLLTRAIEEGIYDQLIDPRLENNFNTVEMARMIASAAACIRHSARKRPKMSQIVRALDGNVSLDDLNEGVRPGQSSIYNSGGDYDANAYNADMIKFRKLALSSMEFLSSEHGTGSSSDSGNQRQPFSPIK